MITRVANDGSCAWIYQSTDPVRGALDCTVCKDFKRGGGSIQAGGRFSWNLPSVMATSLLSPLSVKYYLTPDVFIRVNQRIMRGLITSSAALLPYQYQSAPSAPHYHTQRVRSSVECGFGQDVTSHKMGVDEIYIREFQVNIPYNVTDWTKIYSIGAKNEKVREEERDDKAIKKAGGLGSLPLYILKRWIRFSNNIIPRLKTVSIIHPFRQFFIRWLDQRTQYWIFW